jgi:hypothetical protein
MTTMFMFQAVVSTGAGLFSALTHAHPQMGRVEPEIVGEFDGGVDVVGQPRFSSQFGLVDVSDTDAVGSHVSGFAFGAFAGSGSGEHLPESTGIDVQFTVAEQEFRASSQDCLESGVKGGDVDFGAAAREAHQPVESSLAGSIRQSERAILGEQGAKTAFHHPGCGEGNRVADDDVSGIADGRTEARRVRVDDRHGGSALGQERSTTGTDDSTTDDDDVHVSGGGQHGRRPVLRVDACASTNGQGRARDRR